MPRYKILKTGLYSEPYLNEIGKIVDLHPEIAKAGVEQGYLEKIGEEVKMEKPVKKKKTKK